MEQDTYKSVLTLSHTDMVNILACIVIVMDSEQFNSQAEIEELQGTADKLIKLFHEINDEEDIKLH